MLLNFDIISSRAVCTRQRIGLSVRFALQRGARKDLAPRRAPQPQRDRRSPRRIIKEALVSQRPKSVIPDCSRRVQRVLLQCCSSTRATVQCPVQPTMSSPPPFERLVRSLLSASVLCALRPRFAGFAFIYFPLISSHHPGRARIVSDARAAHKPPLPPLPLPPRGDLLPSHAPYLPAPSTRTS